MSLPDGAYIGGHTATASDTDLDAANIKPGVDLFGVTGTFTNDATATSGDVLSGVTAYVSGNKITGNVADQGNHSGSNGTLTMSLPDGAYIGGHTATASDTDLVAANIKPGVDLFGVTGTFTNDATATSGDVVSGVTAYVSGNKITGNVASQGNVTGSEGQPTMSLTDGIYTSKTATASDSDLVADNIRSGIDLFGVTGTYTNDANATSMDIRTGKSAYVNGAQINGALANGNDVTGSNAALTFDIPDGIYAGKTAQGSDSNLTAANIKSGITLFGVAGSYVGTGKIIIKTGQTTSYVTEDDGDLEKGFDGGYWSTGWDGTSRFTDHGDGTVTDNLTGLMWFKDANASGNLSWSAALTSAENCTYAGYDDWRLPNNFEFFTLIDFGQSNPPLPSGHPFTNLPGTNSDYTWSSNTYLGDTGHAFFYYLNAYGDATSWWLTKTNTKPAWFCRSGPNSN
jgi:hypothetical protein